MDEWKLNPARDFGLPLGDRLRSPKREPGLIETAAHLGWGAALRTYLLACHRLRVDGRENLPRRCPFVMASNHASHLDAPVLASVLPWRLRDKVFPVAAGDTFFEAPVTAAFAAGVINALPLSRRGAGRHALDELRRKLDDDECVYILFPEGTRTRDGSMGRFKPGIGMMVAGSPVPVVPCHLAGTFDALPPDRKRPRCAKITLRIGAPISFAQHENSRAGWEQVASTVEAAVKELAAASGT